MFYFNMEPRLKWNKIVLAWIFMRQCCKLQPIAAFVYRNRQAAAGVAGRQKSEISEVVPC